MTHNAENDVPCEHPTWVRIDGMERHCAACGADYDEATRVLPPAKTEEKK